MHDSHQTDVLSKVVNSLNKCPPQLTGSDPYSDPTTFTAFEHDMERFFSGTFTGNPFVADSFLGSYDESWVAQDASQYPGYAGYWAVGFTVTNSTTLDSFIHPEKWDQAVHDIDWLAPLLGSVFFGDPYAFQPQHQTFYSYDFVNEYSYSIWIPPVPGSSPS